MHSGVVLSKHKFNNGFNCLATGLMSPLSALHFGSRFDHHLAPRATQMSQHEVSVRGGQCSEVLPQPIEALGLSERVVGTGQL